MYLHIYADISTGGLLPCENVAYGESMEGDRALQMLTLCTAVAREV